MAGKQKRRKEEKEKKESVDDPGGEGGDLYQRKDERREEVAREYEMASGLVNWVNQKTISKGHSTSIVLIEPQKEKKRTCVNECLCVFCIDCQGIYYVAGKKVVGPCAFVVPFGKEKKK